MSEEIHSKHHNHTMKRLFFAMGVVVVTPLIAAVGYVYLDIFLARKAILEGEEVLGKATFALRKKIMEFDHNDPFEEFPTLLVHTKVTKRKWYRWRGDLEYSFEFRKSINVPLSLGHPEKKFRSLLRTAKTGKTGDLTDFMDVQMQHLISREHLLDRYYLQKNKSQDFSHTVHKVLNKIENIPSVERDQKIAEMFPTTAKKIETFSPLSRMRPLFSSSEETQPLLRRTSSSSEFSTTFHDDQPSGDGLKAYHRRMASKSLHGRGGGGGGEGGGLRGEVELAPQGPRTYEILNRKAKDIYKRIKDRNFNDIKPSEVQEFLTKENWTLEKVDGSHFIYKKNGVKVRVPVHAARGLATGTCRAIFDQIGVLDR